MNKCNTLLKNCMVKRIDFPNVIIFLKIYINEVLKLFSNIRYINVDRCSCVERDIRFIRGKWVMCDSRFGFVGVYVVL
jgi:hypothetical protein